jgi:hypothetical protein
LHVIVIFLPNLKLYLNSTVKTYIVDSSEYNCIYLENLYEHKAEKIQNTKYRKITNKKKKNQKRVKYLYEYI